MPTVREDLAASGHLRFRVRGENLKLFKAKGMSFTQIHLRVLVHALYADRYPLEFDPRIDCKYQPHVASLDLTGEVKLWAFCGEMSVETIAYVLKHSDAEEVVLAREEEDFDVQAYVSYLKRHIHYRYTTGRLRVLAFRPLDAWFDPEHIDVTADDYVLYQF